MEEEIKCPRCNICPCCNGNGKIVISHRKEKVRELRDKGLTIREIAKVLKIGSTTVQYHLHKEQYRKYQREYKRKIRI